MLHQAHVHPRSIRQLPGVHSAISQFSGYGEGYPFARGESYDELVGDRFRRFAEECDGLSGVHIFAEDCSGFGPLTQSILTELRDDYSGTPTLLFSVRPPAPSQNGSLNFRIISLCVEYPKWLGLQMRRMRLRTRD